MRSVKHQLIEGFDLHEENKVIAIFNGNPGSNQDRYRCIDGSVRVPHRRLIIKITTDEQSEACGNITFTQYQIEMPGGEYVSLHMKWDYQVLVV